MPKSFYSLSKLEIAFSNSKFCFFEISMQSFCKNIIIWCYFRRKQNVDQIFDQNFNSCKNRKTFFFKKIENSVKNVNIWSTTKVKNLIYCQRSNFFSKSKYWSKIIIYFSNIELFIKIRQSDQKLIFFCQRS